MKETTVLVPQTVETILETKKNEYSASRTILCSYSLLNGDTLNANNQIYQQSTHTALTKDRSLTEQERLKCGNDVYKITFINNELSARYCVLFLKKVNG